MKRLLTALLAMTLLMSSCGAPAPLDAPTLQIEADALTEYDYAALAELCADIACETIADDENALTSPLSLYLALALAREGADGETRAEFDAALGCDAEAIYALCRHLTSLEKTTLTVSSSVWLDDDFTPHESYISAARGYFDADTFRLNLPRAAGEINSWASEHTNGMIRKITSNDDLSDALFVLINALYMDAEWWNKFDRDDTKKGEFTNADGKKKNIDFMYNELYARTIDGEGYEGIVLPYRDDSLEFVAIMPTEGASTTELSEKLRDDGSFAALAAAADAEEVKLHLPKFEIESSKILNDVVRSLGITSALSPDLADFSDLADEPLFLSLIKQSVTIRVDEEGTEAAAIVLIKGAGSAAPPENPRIMKFNKPFVFAVIDRDSGAILFSGALNFAT